MDEPRRITPQEIYPKVQSGETLLVCAYDNDAKFRQLRLKGAISLAEFKSRLPTLPRKSCFIAPDPMKAAPPVWQPS